NTKLSVDHRAIVWCNELVDAVSKTLYAIDEGLVQYTNVNDDTLVKRDSRREDVMKVLIGDNASESKLTALSANLEKGYSGPEEYRKYSHADPIVTWFAHVFR